MGAQDKNCCIQWSDYHKNLITVMGELLHSSALTDVTLGTEGGATIECHKMILAACSPYFQDLLGKYTSSRPHIVVPGVECSEVMKIVEFMYKGEMSVTQDKLSPLLEAAEAMKINGILEATGLMRKPIAPILPENGASNVSAEKPKPAKHRRKSYSPVHASSRPYRLCQKSPTILEEQESPLSSKWPLSQGLPLSTEELIAASASFQAALPIKKIRSKSEDEGYVEAPALPINKRKMPRDNGINSGAAILQTALREDPADVSPLRGLQPVCLKYEDVLRRNSTTISRASTDSDRTNERNSVDLSYRSRASITLVSGNSSGNGNVTLPLFSEEMKTVIPDYTPPQNHEGKRYKKYSRKDLNDAIKAVREGMSANKAASLFKVPSRTLYDKIKKLGYTNSKNKGNATITSHSSSNSNSSNSSACFPYGIGRNVDGSIYAKVTKTNNENVSALTITPVIEPQVENTRTFEDSSQSIYDIAAMNLAESMRVGAVRRVERKSPSPRYRPPYIPPILHQPLHLQQQLPMIVDNDSGHQSEAEDLSMKSTKPSIVMKDERRQGFTMVDLASPDPDEQKFRSSKIRYFNHFWK